MKTNVDMDGMLCAAMVFLAGVPANDSREIAPVRHWGLCVAKAGLSAIASQPRASSGQTTAKRMKETIFMVDGAPEGGFEAMALDHSISTDGDDLDTLHEILPTP